MSTPFESLGDTWYSLSKRGRVLTIAVCMAVIVALIGGTLALRAYSEAQKQREIEEAAVAVQQENETAEAEKTVEVRDVENHSPDGIPVNKLPAECVEKSAEFETLLKNEAEKSHSGTTVSQATLDEDRSLDDFERSVVFAVYLQDGSGAKIARLKFSYSKEAGTFTLTGSQTPQEASAETSHEDASADKKEATSEPAATEQTEEPESNGQQTSSSARQASEGSGQRESANTAQTPSQGQAAPETSDSTPSLPSPSPDGSWSTDGGRPSSDGSWGTEGADNGLSWSTD